MPPLDDRLVIDGSTIFLARPDDIPNCPKFIGREDELRLCRAAWGVMPDGKTFNPDAFPMQFRLEGPPGVGKNEIVYRIARELGLPFYMIQGHEELMPEDLALMLVPASGLSAAGLAGSSNLPLVLRASALATALHEGGIFFFDEINRVPERSLTPLASVLDSRRELYSAMTGFRIKAKNPDAQRTFRFCCALNPGAAESGKGVLADYIDERTLPIIEVGYPTIDELIEIIEGKLPATPASLAAFREWYGERALRKVSTRQALSLMQYLLNTMGPGRDPLATMKGLERRFFRSGDSPVHESGTLDGVHATPLARSAPPADEPAPKAPPEPVIPPSKAGGGRRAKTTVTSTNNPNLTGKKSRK